MRLLLCLTLLLLTACGGSDTAPQPDASTGEADIVVGVSMLSMTHVFFQELAETMRTSGAENGMEVLLTSCEFDIAKQKDQVNDFIVRRVDAIVLAPCDSKAIGTSVEAANEAGIPVFTVDIAVLADGAEVVSHIATDNYSGGKLAGEALVEALGGTGKVAIIDHPEVESVIMRTRGFREVVDAANADGASIEIVAALPSMGVKDRAYRVAEDVLQATPDLDGFFAINDQTALGAVAAIEKAGKLDQVKVIGFDGTPEARQAIAEGKIHADVIQHPSAIAEEAIQAILNYRNGESVPPEILIPATLYAQADAKAEGY